MKTTQYLKRLTLTYFIFSALIALLLILQTVGNKFDDTTYLAWIWMSICVFPIGVLLSYIFFNNRQYSFISKTQFHVLFSLSLIYLLLVFLTLILAANKIPPISMLQQSYWWLLPIQILLLTSLFFVSSRSSTSKNILLADESLDEIDFNIDVNSLIKRDRVRIFLSYDNSDEKLLHELEKQLSTFKRNQLIETWNNQKVLAGQIWDDAIAQKLNGADVILLLVSSNFIANDKCYEHEMKIALSKHEKGTAVVLPILLRHCNWEDTDFGKLPVLPTNRKPITDRYWSTHSEAFNNVILGIKKVLKEICLKEEQKENFL